MCGIGDQSTSNTQAKVDEARQRKREREKARWAAMTQEEKDEKIKNVDRHITLEKQKLHSLVDREVTPWSSYNQAIIYIDIYILANKVDRRITLEKQKLHMCVLYNELYFSR
jgi:hypothetical protein